MTVSATRIRDLRIPDPGNEYARNPGSEYPGSGLSLTVLFENVFLRYRDFKLRDPFLAKIGPFLPNNFENPKNIRYFEVLYDINHGDT